MAGVGWVQAIRRVPTCRGSSGTRVVGYRARRCGRSDGDRGGVLGVDVEDRIGELPDGKDGIHALPEQWDGSMLAPITWGREQVKKNWKKIFGGVSDITAEVVPNHR